MRSPRRLALPVALALLALSGAPGASRAVEGYVAADPGAPAVTRENLLASDRFWPYHVALTEAWQPEGREKPLPEGLRGVLVRVEPPGEAARVDFGRDGVHAVPVGRTDLVERADRVRRGEEEKIAPNFVHAVGPRLMDSVASYPTPVLFSRVFDPPGFLAVFADPGAHGFDELAAALEPLHERHGVWTVVFPQGGHDDARVHERLRAAGWTVPFVRDYLVEGYTRSRLPEGTPLPAVVLQTRDGRVIHEGAWSPGAAGDLRAALDGAFAQAPATARADLEEAP